MRKPFGACVIALFSGLAGISIPGNVFGQVSGQMKPNERLHNPTSVITISFLLGVSAWAWSILTRRLNSGAVTAALVFIAVYCALAILFAVWPSAIFNFFYADTFTVFEIRFLVGLLGVAALAFWTKRVVSE